MEKKWLEIGISTGLVALMIALLLVVEIAVPMGFKSQGFALVLLLFIVAMGFAGLKLMDIP